MWRKELVKQPVFWSEPIESVCNCQSSPKTFPPSHLSTKSTQNIQLNLLWFIWLLKDIAPFFQISLTALNVYHETGKNPAWCQYIVPSNLHCNWVKMCPEILKLSVSICFNLFGVNMFQGRALWKSHWGNKWVDILGTAERQRHF